MLFRYMDHNDVLKVCSYSGKTHTILNLMNRANEVANPKIATITGDINSPMAKLSKCVVGFKSSNGGLNSADNDMKISSIQPMTTLNEQAMFIFFDIVTLMLMDELSMSIEDTKEYHFNVE